MDDLPPRMAHHLGSRYTQASDMALGLYWAVDEVGLRLPSRRDIARHALISEPTISRRFRDSRSSEEALVTRLVGARGNTHPRGYPADGLTRWLPEEDAHLRDVRVWMACLALAAFSNELAEAVVDVWRSERVGIGVDLGPGGRPGDLDRDEIIQAVVLGLSIRRSLDRTMSHDRALALLERAGAALA